MQQIQSLYLEFLANFPTGVRPVISILLAVLLVYSVIKVIKKDFLYIIALVVLLPASQPILKNVWEGAVSLVKFLISTK